MAAKSERRETVCEYAAKQKEYYFIVLDLGETLSFTKKAGGVTNSLRACACWNIHQDCSVNTERKKRKVT